MDVLEFPPFDAARTAAFAALMGDENPLHRETGGAGMPEALLPGALLSLLAERTIAVLRGDRELVRMNLLFLRPVKIGVGLTMALRDGPHINLGGRAARRVRLTGTSEKKICLVADCILAAPEAESASHLHLSRQS